MRVIKQQSTSKPCCLVKLTRLSISLSNTLRGRLTLYFLLLAFSTVSITSAIFLHQATNHLNQAVFAHFNTAVQLESSRIKQLLEQQQQQLQWLAQQPTVQAMFNKPPEPNNDRFLQLHIRLFDFALDELQLINATGLQTLASSSVMPAPLTADLSQRLLQDTPSLIIALPLLHLTAPIHTAEHQLQGVLIASFDSEAFGLTLPYSIRETLPQARLTLRSSPPAAYTLTSAQISRYQRNGQRWLGSWQWLVQSQLLLLMESPENAALISQTTLVKTCLLSSLVVLILMILSAYRLIHRLMMPLWSFIAIATAIRNGDLSKRVKAYSIYEFDHLGNMLNHMAQHLKQTLTDLEQQVDERTILNRAYERFVPRQFLKLLDKQSITEVKLGDQIEKEMTILFSDIRDFTSLSETLTPQANFDFINNYLTVMEPLIYENNGVIDKYIGDAIMALFPRNADDAVQAAINMMQHLKQFNHQLIEQDRPAIKIGIGLNTGQLMLGMVGGENRMDGTVIADAVNLASRVEALTKIYGASVLITTETYLKLENPQKYHIRLVDAVQVKGKSETVTVYEVYDADEPEIVALKDQTREDFEVAIMIYENDDFSEAAPLFETVLAQNPADNVAQIYLERCTQALNALMPAMPTVLIVDDTSFTLLTLSDLLNTYNYRVLTAESGEAALELLKKQIPHLILLDIMMPGVDGFEMCQLLKNNPQTQEIPIIFMTAVSDVNSKIKGFKLGAVDYITKPFNSEEVLARIQNHISIRHMYYQLKQKNRVLESDHQELLERLRQYKTERKLNNISISPA